MPRFSSSRRDDELRLEKVALPALLMRYVTNVAPGPETAAKRLVDTQLDQLRTGVFVGSE